MPKLRFPGFEGEWSAQTLRDAFAFIQNNTLPRSRLSTTYGKVRDIHYGDILVKFGDVLDFKKDDVPFIKEQSSSFPTRQLRDGDIILADTAEDETVGKAVEVFGLGNTKSEAGLHTIACRPFRRYEPCFMGYYFNSPSYHRQLLPLMQGIKVLSLSKSQVAGTTIRFPVHEAEQQRIAKFFTYLDSRIAAQRRLVGLLKKHKRGVIEEIFGQDNTDWNRCRLGDITTINPSTGTLPSEFYYIDLESVSDGVWGRRTLVRREDAPSRAQRNVALEDILFQTVRPYQQNNYFVECELDKPIVASTGYAQIRTSEEPLFVYWMLHSLSFLREVMLRCTGSGYPAVNTADLAKIVVAVPNRADQRRYATSITQIAKRCNSEEAILSLLESSKRGLLQKLFV